MLLIGHEWIATIARLLAIILIQCLQLGKSTEYHECRIQGWEEGDSERGEGIKQ